MILDTCFIIDLLRNSEEAVRKLEDIEKNNVSWGVTSATFMELWYGTKRNGTSVEKLNKLLETNLVMELDKEGAKKAGELKAFLEKKGTPIGIMDMLIAGIVLSSNETLLTKDMHFSEIEELKTETY